MSLYLLCTNEGSVLGTDVQKRLLVMYCEDYVYEYHSLFVALEMRTL